MLKTRQLVGSIGDEHRNLHLIEGTAIAPLAKAASEIAAEWPKFRKLTTERQQAHIAKNYEKNAAKADAREAGRRGEKYDVKAAKKRLAEAKSIRNELDLRWEEAAGRLGQMIADYRALLVEHFDDLRAEALAAAEKAVLSLTTARGMADKAQGELDASFGVLAGLEFVAAGDHYKPGSLRAGGRKDRAPIPHLGIAVAGLATAIGLSLEVVEEQKTAAPKVVDEAALVEGTEDEDDWEDDDDDD